MAELPETCGKGHNDWMMRANGLDRKPTRSCRTCRRINTKRAQARRNSRAMRLPRHHPGEPSVTWQPLEDAFALREMNPKDYVQERTIQRWRVKGVLRISSADAVCCEVLGVHPANIYGNDWYAFDEETA